MRFMAIAPRRTQLQPHRRAATNNCHGDAATDQPKTPSARSSAPVKVTFAMPNRSYTKLEFATRMAPHKKCTVTELETNGMLHPVHSTTACRKTGGS